MSLVKVISEYNIKSISIPPLGCGNGGLNWDKVKVLMEKYLGGLNDVDILVYEPDATVKEILQKENQTKHSPGQSSLFLS